MRTVILFVGIHIGRAINPDIEFNTLSMIGVYALYFAAIWMDVTYFIERNNKIKKQ